MRFSSTRKNNLPRNDIRRILLVSGRAVIEFDPLCVRQCRCFPFKALPQNVKQFEFLRCGKASDFVLQIAHAITLHLLYETNGRGHNLRLAPTSARNNTVLYDRQLSFDRLQNSAIGLAVPKPNKNLEY
jgi:hypothetical protein